MPRPLKIAILAPFYVPYPGGQEVHTKFLVDHLRAFNVDITVITTNKPQQRSIEFDGNVKIVRLGYFFEVFNNPFCLGLLQTLMKIDADIFHVQGYWSLFANIAAMVAFLRNIPIVYTSHGFQQNIYKRGILGRLFVQFYIKILGHFMFRVMDAITCNHAEDSEILKKIGIKENKIHIIPSGLNVANYLNVVNRISDQDLNEIKTRYQLKSPILFYIGRLVERKGCHFLLKTMPIVLDRFPTAKLIVVGEGPEEKKFHNLVKDLNIQDHVIFTGYIEPLSKQLLSLYKIADVQILPSFSESMPVVVMEGLLFGVPQLVTDRHFAKWIQYHGDPLYISINPTNTSDFAEKIISTLENEEYRKKIKRVGPEFVQNELDWSKLTSRIFNLYKTFIKNKKKLKTTNTA